LLWFMVGGLWYGDGGNRFSKKTATSKNMFSENSGSLERY